jgi:hypothetical protein
MTTINDAFINALLADAAYVDGITINSTGSALALQLANRMTPDLAKYIGANFTVATQVGGLASSFDATVWRGNAGTPYAGQIYVSMRGTQGSTDIAADIDLASTGLAHKQLADMANWWLRATTPTLTDAGTPQYATQITVAPNGTFALTSGALGTGELASVIAIKSVNGHSLGGYLASSFSRLFGTKWPIEMVNTFNSAGFSSPASANIESGFNRIGGMRVRSQVLNARGWIFDPSWSPPRPRVHHPDALLQPRPRRAALSSLYRSCARRRIGALLI